MIGQLYVKTLSADCSQSHIARQQVWYGRL